MSVLTPLFNQKRTADASSDFSPSGNAVVQKVPVEKGTLIRHFYFGQYNAGVTARLVTAANESQELGSLTYRELKRQDPATAAAARQSYIRSGGRPEV